MSTVPAPQKLGEQSLILLPLFRRPCQVCIIYLTPVTNTLKITITEIDVSAFVIGRLSPNIDELLAAP